MFIVLEGIDGSGTTTQGQELTAAIQELGEKVVFTNEPSAGPAGFLIRLALARRLVGPGGGYHDESGTPEISTALDPMSFALLFAADRMDHIATQITPALQSGRHVICDRYVLSSLAYQGVDLDPEWVMEINKFASKPDLTIFLDVPAERAKGRMSASRWVKDLFEEEEQLRQVRLQYLAALKKFEHELGPVAVVDAEEEIWRVRAAIWKLVDPLLQQRTELRLL